METRGRHSATQEYPHPFIHEVTMTSAQRIRVKPLHLTPATNRPFVCVKHLYNNVLEKGFEASVGLRVLSNLKVPLYGHGPYLCFLPSSDKASHISLSDRVA